MSATRCCARCKHPMVSCRNTECKCHGSDIDADIIPLRAAR
jgi:transposase